MLSFKKYFVNRVCADATLQNYLKDSNGNMNVFPAGVDLLPEQFPCITYSEVGTTLSSNPKGLRIGMLQVDIYSIKNQLEVENIKEQLGVLFNYRDSTQDSFIGTLWWVREENSRSEYISDRRLWKMSVDFKVWMTNTNRL